ncbi:MAG: ABC-2 family transporter protein [Lachnospiraceae bacterium]|nr:ABC-2 family transporter protein [Lachnospiraceae bacterium]MDE6233722.1 ABC-2 family transporter protein [Lachnospiraceae bacterium]MDE6253464.1 ABC-2 family transporter protein [Lachnospiraceae bacterium]
MNSIKKIKRMYGAFTNAGIQDFIAYRASFVGFFLGEILICFVMYFIWKAVYASAGNSTFMGFSMVDMMVYIFLTNIAGFLTGTDSTYSIAEEIKDGSIIMRLIKPVKVDLSFLFFELGNKVMIISCVFIPVILGLEIYRYVMLGYVAFNPVRLILFMFSISISYLLAFYLNLIFGYLAFFLLNLWGFNILKESIIKFFSGAIIPLAFFPEVVRNIFEYLPFASLTYTPVMIYMEKYNGSTLLLNLGLQLLWLSFFIWLSKLIWKWAERRLAVQGG